MYIIFKSKSIIRLAIIIIICFPFSNCKYWDKNVESNKDFITYRHNFDEKFISQFPQSIKSKFSYLECNTNPEKNNIGLYLFEYKKDRSFIDSVLRNKNQFIAAYKSTDTCLLIVNRLDTLDNFAKVIITDSMIIDRNCCQSLYPIPNFKISDEDSIKGRVLHLDSTFSIYVLESNTNNPFGSKYSMSPNAQMPKRWEHGYSKGLAASRRNNVVIYWSIMW